MDVIDAPQHPYVQLLIDSVPVPDPTDKWDVNISLPSEEEMRTAASVGCRYYPRCPHRMDRCLEEQPPLFKMDKPKHEAACYLYEDREIAPIEAPILYSKPKTDELSQPTRRSRVPWAAAFIAAIVAAAVAVYAINQNNAAIAAEATAEARGLKRLSRQSPKQPPRQRPKNSPPRPLKLKRKRRSRRRSPSKNSRCRPMTRSTKAR